ncbi:hypothetical protein BRLA_c015710 [Brevibacillus laterosporus LMG 15441]|uniref:Uncharacterized protein n=1 Tax=Brevibacillus laterosporus LMG 15441 TaxID=1042163 RepID=A0A075R8L3_BRELA|nr:hypothetical protein BRLA_c015710 [Brevibacillus laterosporus LMG 15441]
METRIISVTTTIAKTANPNEPVKNNMWRIFFLSSTLCPSLSTRIPTPVVLYISIRMRSPFRFNFCLLFYLFLPRISELNRHQRKKSASIDSYSLCLYCHSNQSSIHLSFLFYGYLDHFLFFTTIHFWSSL